MTRASPLLEKWDQGNKVRTCLLVDSTLVNSLSWDRSRWYTRSRPEAVFKASRSSEVVTATSSVGFPKRKYQVGLRLRNLARGTSSGVGTMARLSGLSGLVLLRGSLSAGIYGGLLFFFFIRRKGNESGSVHRSSYRSRKGRTGSCRCCGYGGRGGRRLRWVYWVGCTGSRGPTCVPKR